MTAWIQLSNRRANMAYKETHEYFNIFLARLTEKLQVALSEEQDERIALQKAVLGLIAITQNVLNPVLRTFVDYILDRFPPIAAAFSSDDIHPLQEDLKVRKQRNGDHTELLFPEPAMAKLMRQPISKKDIRAAGVRLPWKLSASRYVAFYDIMGFRDFVKRNRRSHKTIYKVMESLHQAGERARELSTLMFGKELSTVFDAINIVQFSDSIVAMTADTSQESAGLITLASQVLFIRALQEGTVLRGAVAAGHFTADFQKSIFFGQPLVDAYLLEEDQAWYGVAFHPSATRLERRRDKGREFPPPPKGWIPMTVSQKVFLKSIQGYRRLMVINWPALLPKSPPVSRWLPPQ
jgi:hypothetical protein